MEKKEHLFWIQLLKQVNGYDFHQKQYTFNILFYTKYTCTCRIYYKTVHYTHAEFTIKDGDVTYLTKSYYDLLKSEQLKSERSSQDKQKRGAATSYQRWIWPNCVIPYVLNDAYTGKFNYMCQR